MAQNIGSLEVDLSINSNTQQGTDEAKKDLEKVQTAAETLSETFDETAKTAENAANKMQEATNALADGIGETTSAIDGLNVSTDESVEKLYNLTVQMLEMVKNGEEQTEQYAEIKESIEDLLSAHQELRENPPFSQEQYETLREYQDGLQAIAETTENVAAQTAEVDLSTLRDEMQHLIPIQEKALQQLSKIYDENTAHIKALEEEIAQISESEQNTEKIENLNAELEARKALNEEVEASKQAFESANIQQQLKAVKLAMQNLYAAGKEDTEMYKELMQEAGRLADIKGDVAAQTAILSNDEANIKATTDALGGVNSALATADTGMSMLGVSSAQLTKVMTDLNSVQKIFNGLATVSAALNKDSYARRIATITATKVQTSVTNLLTKAHLSEAAAAKVATVATAAATAGLTLLIPVLYSIISKFRELSQAQEEIHTAMADAAAPAIVAVEKLSAKWDKLGDNLDEKRKFIAENSDEFKNLGANVQSVADAEALLSDGASKFIQSLMAKAKAAAAYNLIVEKQKELIEAQLTYGGKKNANGDYEGDTGFHLWTEGGVNALFSDEAAQQGNKAYLEKETEKINDIIENYKDIAKDAEEEIEKISKELGNALLPDEQTQSLIQNIKNAKTVFDNYRASLDSQNEGVKSYYAKQLKEFQERQGTAATTYKAYLQELKKNPLYNSKDSVLSVINEGILNDKSDPIKELIERRKKEYAEYSKLQNSTSAEIRSEADKQYSALIRQGANYEEYLKNLREKYKGNLAALKKINLELIETERQGMMDLFKTDFEKQMTFAKNAAEQLKVIAETRAAITDTDPQKREKNAVLDDKIKSISTSSTNDLANAQKSYSDYLTSLLPETVRYQREVQRLRLQFERETDEKAAEILFNEMQAAEIRLQMAQNKEKIDNAKSLADQLVQIEIKRQQDIAAINADESYNKKQKEDLTTQINAFSDADIEILKGQFTDVDEDFVDSILKMTEEATAGQIGVFVKMINDIQTQIETMRQNGQTDTSEFIKLQSQLEITKNAYAAFQTNAKSATQKAAKDPALKKISAAFQDLGNSLQDVSDNFNGVISDIMKVTGQMLTSASSIINSIQTLAIGTMKSVEGTSTAAAAAIRTVETASVVLAIIEAALQVAMSIINLFNKDKETYQDRKQVYDAYISTLDMLIERERKLTETLTAQDAALSFGKIEQYYKDKIKVEKQAAKDYLGTREKHEHSNWYKLNEKLDISDWENIDKALGTYKTKEVKSSNPRGLTGRSYSVAQVSADLGDLYESPSRILDLTVEQLKAIQTQAYATYAKLPQEMRDAIEAIIEADEAIMQLKDDMREQATGTSRETFVDSFKESLFDLDITAEKVSNNIHEYMRKALILNLYKNDFQKDINDYYEKFADFVEDGIVTKEEQETLDELENKITTGLETKLNNINKNFKIDDEEEVSGLSGAIKNASQESIDLLAGQTNAVRMNQVEAMTLARESLTATMEINANVVLCARFLSSINNAVKSPNSNRSQGIM